MGADLSKGFNTFQQLDEGADGHLDGLLQTIMNLERRTDSECQANFMTWRGMVTKIMAAPFDTFNGPIFGSFIEEHHAHKLESRQAQHIQVSRPGAASQDLMSYWGTSLLFSAPKRYKFETLSLLPAPWAETPSSSPINWDGPKVELKTAATPLSDHDILKYERKLLKFWIQSFLLGVPKIIVGFRSKDGILESLEELETANIPTLVKLKGLTTTITEDGGVWRIQKMNKAPVIEVFKVAESGYGDILLKEFIEWRCRPSQKRTL
ncbi:MAG: hypothetical protein LQ348_004280 [Seirophora lacunosa]|nr:MAG: hypothetical protein LQ348_004280 [Seirophora lacunosa]